MPYLGCQFRQTSSRNNLLGGGPGLLDDRTVGLSLRQLAFNGLYLSDDGHLVLIGKRGRGNLPPELA